MFKVMFKFLLAGEIFWKRLQTFSSLHSANFAWLGSIGYSSGVFLFVGGYSPVEMKSGKVWRWHERH